MDHRLSVGITALKKAGKYLNNNFLKKHRVSIKADKTILLGEDLEAESLIINTISKKFPSDTFLTEETATSFNNNVWVIDPLCGSYSYLRGVETWSISAAFYFDGKPKFGIVYQPYFNNLYYGQIGVGAFINRQPIKPSSVNSLNDAFVSVEHGVFNDHNLNVLKLVDSIKRLRVGHGSGAELSYVAAGHLDAVIKTKQSIMHYAGGRAIVESSGGVFVDFSNNSAPHHLDRNKTMSYIACSNLTLASQIIGVLTT